jgi:hypothetical protein
LKLNELEAKINQTIRQAGSKEVMLILAKKAKEVLYLRVKSGKGIGKQQLKPLSNSYKKQRSKLSLGDKGTANKSNLTLTGQMLDAISYEVAKDYFKLYIKASSRYAAKPSWKTPVANNKQVAEYVSKERPFFELADDEKLIIEREFNSIIKNIVKLNFG